MPSTSKTRKKRSASLHNESSTFGSNVNAIHQPHRHSCLLMQCCVAGAASCPISLWRVGLRYDDRGQNPAPCVNRQCAHGCGISLPLLFRQRCPAKTVPVWRCYPTCPEKLDAKIVDCPQCQLSAPRAVSYACSSSPRVVPQAAFESVNKRHA